MRCRTLLATCLPFLPIVLCAKDKSGVHETLAAYVQRVQSPPVAVIEKSIGSLWVDRGRLANLAADYKASAGWGSRDQTRGARCDGGKRRKCF